MQTTVDTNRTHTVLSERIRATYAHVPFVRNRAYSILEKYKRFIPLLAHIESLPRAESLAKFLECLPDERERTVFLLLYIEEMTGERDILKKVCTVVQYAQ